MQTETNIPDTIEAVTAEVVSILAQGYVRCRNGRRRERAEQEPKYEKEERMNITSIQPLSSARQPSPEENGATRCAIYTRKSTDEGLEQEFNSLDAQPALRVIYRRWGKNVGGRII